jgi:PPM family protein phosphatase
MSDASDVDTSEYPLGGAPPPPPVRVEFGAMSHPGRVRQKNEDHFLIGRIRRSLSVLRTSLPAAELPPPRHEDGYAMVVADGLGGSAAGEMASMLAIRTGLELVRGSPRWGLRINEDEAQALIERMRAYYLQVDSVLLDHARAHPELAGMATTLTVAYSAGPDLFLVHAGDSRAYLYHDATLYRLTRDHTLAQMLADAGKIAPEEVEGHGHRNVLVNCLGGSGHGVAPAVAHLRLADGDRVLLCTDGLTTTVDDALIAETLRLFPAPDDACKALVELALDCGGTDNVTVVLACYAIPA